FVVHGRACQKSQNCDSVEDFLLHNLDCFNLVRAVLRGPDERTKEERPEHKCHQQPTVLADEAVGQQQDCVHCAALLGGSMSATNSSSRLRVRGVTLITVPPPIQIFSIACRWCCLSTMNVQRPFC